MNSRAQAKGKVTTLTDIDTLFAVVRVHDKARAPCTKSGMCIFRCKVVCVFTYVWNN